MRSPFPYGHSNADNPIRRARLDRDSISNHRGAADRANHALAACRLDTGEIERVPLPTAKGRSRGSRFGQRRAANIGRSNGLYARPSASRGAREAGPFCARAPDGHASAPFLIPPPHFDRSRSIETRGHDVKRSDDRSQLSVVGAAHVVQSNAAIMPQCAGKGRYADQVSLVGGRDNSNEEVWSLRFERFICTGPSNDDAAQSGRQTDEWPETANCGRRGRGHRSRGCGRPPHAKTHHPTTTSHRRSRFA